MTAVNTLIIGASAAGLASAACLKKKGIEFIILEKNSKVANSWRNHYDRLHLHTSKKWSALPYKAFDQKLPKYPSRQNVVDYLDEYSKELNISPVFNTEVLSVKKEGSSWITDTSNGTFQSSFVIVATGLNNKSKVPEWKGMNSFRGLIIHSSWYKNGKSFSGQNVLVVGFGNSACEQAICLHENGAFPSLSVRSTVNVLPRDLFGIPILELGKFTSMFSSRVADKINAPIIKLAVGDISKLGLKKSAYGPREQIEKQKRIPLLDIGTIDLIREGHIKVYGDIKWIEGNTVYFDDGKQQTFDAIICATGYQHNLESFLSVNAERMNDLGREINKQDYFGVDGLYFCGFYLSPKGMLHEIGTEATRNAKDIEKKTKRQLK